jgi:DNA-binding transcriptional ArsR family regulator
MANGEVSVGFLADSLGESQPKISRHLAYLRGAGLVSTRRDGKWIYYTIAEQGNAPAQSMLAAALQTISGEPLTTARPTVEPAPRELSSDIYAQADMTEWQPSELDVFLL